MAMEGDVKTFRAAQYVRMSTEHQQYSTSNQGDKIKEYADKRGYSGPQIQDSSLSYTPSWEN